MSGLERELQRLGIRVRDDWLAACTAHLQSTSGPFLALSLDKQVRAPLLPAAQRHSRGVAQSTGVSGHVCARAGHTDSSPTLRRVPAPARCNTCTPSSWRRT